MKGLSISYDRIMLYHQLHKNTFTSTPKDNNLKPSTASTSIHWTSISIFQHPEEAVTIAPFRFESHCA